MRTAGILFVCSLLCIAGSAQALRDRYLELTKDTLSHEALGANFLHTYFSSSPQAFFLNRSAWNDIHAWEVVKTGSDIYEFKAMNGRNLFATYSSEGLCAETANARTDQETFCLLGQLFRRAILLAEDTDGYSAGLDGYTCYFAATDKGETKVAQKWSPEPESLTRALTDLGDSICRRIARHETDWNKTKKEIRVLMETLNNETISAVRNPIYRGLWRTGVQQLGPEKIAEAPQPPGYRNIEDYFYENMIYPPEMLADGRGGYAVYGFTIDTLGFIKPVHAIDSSEPACAKETARLIAGLKGHWLPARDESGKPVECLYYTYISFRPQRYYTLQKLKQAAKEWERQAFVNPEKAPEYPGGMKACMQFVREQAMIHYPESCRGTGRKAKAVCQFTIDSYGQVKDCRIVRGSGTDAFDEAALQVIRNMPRWKPGAAVTPYPHFCETRHTITINFSDSEQK